MAVNTMSLNKFAAALVCMASMSASASNQVQCPSTYSDGHKTGLLADADVFQGPPKNRASMLPDEDTSEWDLHGYQEDAQDRGESLFLVCRYAGINATATIEIPRAATFCKVEDRKEGTIAMCGTKPTEHPGRGNNKQKE